jgi:hypothetical protein
MLSDEQIDHYRTFGFLVLPGYLEEGETAALGAELDRAHRDAFGARYDERPDRGGIDGHYLPMMSRDRTPRSLALVEDPRFLAAARSSSGRPSCRSTPRASSTSVRPASTTTPARASRRSSSSPTWSR